MFSELRAAFGKFAFPFVVGLCQLALEFKALHIFYPQAVSIDQNFRLPDQTCKPLPCGECVEGACNIHPNQTPSRRFNAFEFLKLDPILSKRRRDAQPKSVFALLVYQASGSREPPARAPRSQKTSFASMRPNVAGSKGVACT